MVRSEGTMDEMSRRFEDRWQLDIPTRWVRTDMAQGRIDNPDALAKEMARSTVGRFGGPDEIAEVMRMLASASGGCINGQTIRDVM